MTNTQTPETPESRLDRIERILAITASQQQTNTNALAQLTERVDSLTADVGNLTNDVGNLTGAIADYIVEAEADREVIKQNQAEIRRIWEYLLRIGGNGNGRSEG